MINQFSDLLHLLTTNNAEPINIDVSHNSKLNLFYNLESEVQTDELLTQQIYYNFKYEQLKVSHILMMSTYFPASLQLCLFSWYRIFQSGTYVKLNINYLPSTLQRQILVLLINFFENIMEEEEGFLYLFYDYVNFYRLLRNMVIDDTSATVNWREIMGTLENYIIKSRGITLPKKEEDINEIILYNNYIMSETKVDENILKHNIIMINIMSESNFKPKYVTYFFQKAFGEKSVSTKMINDKIIFTALFVNFE